MLFAVRVVIKMYSDNILCLRLSDNGNFLINVRYSAQIFLEFIVKNHRSGGVNRALVLCAKNLGLPIKFGCKLLMIISILCSFLWQSQGTAFGQILNTDSKNRIHYSGHQNRATFLIVNRIQKAIKTHRKAHSEKEYLSLVGHIEFNVP
jgi:hypothetical protein